MSASVAGAQAGSVIEARGEATYRLPIVVPPGPAGHQPDLALVYNSGEGKGPAGPFGFAWSLAGESRIERETRTGTPYDFDNMTCGATPCYRADVVLDGQDLICSSGTCTTCSSGAPCRYRTQSDDGRLIEFLGTSGWRIRDRDGRTLEYGKTTAAQIVNGANAQVFSWQIETSTDVSGNQIAYTYDTASSPNVAYLQRISWGIAGSMNRSVDFVLNHATNAPRPDRPVTARSGMRQQFDRRVVQIDVKAASDALVTRYLLTYGSDPDSLRSRLAAVQRGGSDCTSTCPSSLPPYMFSYSERASEDGFKQTNEPGFWSSATTCAPIGGVWIYQYDGWNYRNIADMNRDGLADLYLVHDFLQDAGRAEVALGTGTRFRPGLGMSCASPNDERGTPWSVDRLLFGSGSGTFSTSATMDLDGDGYLDHFDLGGSPAPGPVIDTVPSGFRLGSASGFSAATYQTSFDLPHPSFAFGCAVPAWESWIRYAEDRDYYIRETYGILADVTGDGRPDLVCARDSYPFFYSTGSVQDPTWTSWNGLAVFVNRGLKPAAGEGWYLDFGTVPLKWPAFWGLFENRTIDTVGLNGTTWVAFADQNGDGLPDQLGGASVSYGYGAGFGAFEPLSNNLGNVLAESLEYTTIGLYDLNGDGFLDHVSAVGNLVDAFWEVHFGTGHGFNPTMLLFRRVIENPDQPAIEAGPLVIGPRSIRDVNGDGRLDYVADGRGSVFMQEGMLSHTGAKSEPLAGLLTRAIDPLGGTTEFSYSSALQFQDANGLPANPDMSMPKPVVVRMSLSDGRAGTPKIVNEYVYAGGVFDYAEKEFRGFATVIATQIENGLSTTQTTSTYLTDRTCAFNPASEGTTLGASVLTRESMTYQTVTGGGTGPAQWNACLLASSVVESVEGNEASKKVRRTSWIYDANYNVTERQEWGEWNLATDQNVPGDERITTLTYATPTASRPSILSRVIYETVKDVNGNVYAKRQHCYVLSCPGTAHNGQLVRVKDYLTDYVANPPIVDQARTVATIVYDAYGNPTQTTGVGTTDDGNGLQTAIAYDATYQTFPVSVSRGSDVALPLRPLVTTLAYTGCAGGFSPPPALGLPCSVTAPQGQADVLGYDTFGRVKRVERPTSAYAEARTYTLPGSASPGQNILETRIIRPDLSDLVEKQYMDGLSRIYKSESPAKQAQTAIVDRTFDDRGRLRTESLPYFTGGGQLRTFSYDALGRPATELDPDLVTQRVQTYTPWTVIDETYFGPVAAGNRKQRSERSADGLGRLIRVAQYADAVAATTPYLVTAKYDPTDRLYEVSDPIANNGTLCTSLNMGAQCATQDHVTEIQWDTFGRRVKIDDPDSGVWTYRYDDAGLVKERTQSGGTSSARSQFFTYDHLERLSAKTFTPTGNGTTDASFVYENNDASPDYGQLLQVVPGGTSGTTYVYGYDAAGRRDAVIQRTAGKEFGSAWTYDELDRVTSRLFPDGESFDYGYDGLRLVNILADSANPAFQGTVLKSADYDALGRMKTIEVGQGSGSAALATLAYTYDSTNARLTRVAGTPGNLLAGDPDGDHIAPASSDKCQYAYDPEQIDSGGLGASSVPDGIGNACQCGDVNGSGKVTTEDANLIIAFYLTGGQLAQQDLCDVNGDGPCDQNDYYAVNTAVNNGTGNLQNCLPSKPANLPSSAGLDLTVGFDGLGRLTSQTGTLGSESVNRTYTYDGLSRLMSAVGPWEKGTGATGSVTWSYTYDALGNLRQQASNRTPSFAADNRTWRYDHATKPHYLSAFEQQGKPTESMTATLGGEPASIYRGTSYPTESFTWNAQGKLRSFKDSTYSYDAFDEATLAVTGPSGSSTSIVSVGDDFEYDLGADRANKFFSLDGVRIASLGTSYVAPNAAIPPALRIVIRYAEPLAAPAAAALLSLGLLSLASLTLRRRTPVWLSVPGVGVLSFALVALPYTAWAATLTSGPGKYGRHAEPILAYLVDHLGTVRAAVNQDGIVVETRDYAPFGASIVHVGPFSVQHRFTGQPQDDQAGGLYNYGARFYNAKWGRFVSPDEVVQGFDSQGLNPFAYVLNRPTSGIDPSGEFFDFPAISMPSIGTMAFGLGAAASAGGVAAAGDPPCGGDACLTRPDYEASVGLDALPVVAALRLAPGTVGKVAVVVVVAGIIIHLAAKNAQEDSSEKEENKEKAKDKGIPEDRLGPSGRPKIHRTRFPTEKAAKEAAKEAGKGNPMKHANPKTGRPHYHPTDASGRKIPGQHFEF